MSDSLEVLVREGVTKLTAALPGRSQPLEAAAASLLRQYDARALPLPYLALLEGATTVKRPIFRAKPGLYGEALHRLRTEHPNWVVRNGDLYLVEYRLQTSAGSVSGSLRVKEEPHTIEFRIDVLGPAVRAQLALVGADGYRFLAPLPPPLAPGGHDGARLVPVPFDGAFADATLLGIARSDGDGRIPLGGETSLSPAQPYLFISVDGAFSAQRLAPPSRDAAVPENRAQPATPRPPRPHPPRPHPQKPQPLKAVAFPARRGSPAPSTLIVKRQEQRVYSLARIEEAYRGYLARRDAAGGLDADVERAVAWITEDWLRNPAPYGRAEKRHESAGRVYPFKGRHAVEKLSGMSVFFGTAPDGKLLTVNVAPHRVTTEYEGGTRVIASKEWDGPFLFVRDAAGRPVGAKVLPGYDLQAQLASGAPDLFSPDGRTLSSLAQSRVGSEPAERAVLVRDFSLEEGQCFVDYAYQRHLLLKEAVRDAVRGADRAGYLVRLWPSFGSPIRISLLAQYGSSVKEIPMAYTSFAITGGRKKAEQAASARA